MKAVKGNLGFISFLLVLGILLYWISPPVFSAIPPQEREALIALYNSTNGDNWTDNSGWKTPPLHTDGFALPGTENTWYGITCDSGNAAVQRIQMYGQNMDGTIPPELENLANLTYVFLSNNRLSGSIPSEMGNLENLTYLNLELNQLSGSIPPELGNLANLQTLGLNANQLSGSIPPELGNLANLQELGLTANQLSGSIPPELGNLANLTSLGLHSNQLTGSIPPELGSLANLQNLFLSSNQLSGSIPPELGNLANLQNLLIGWNQLSGSIPSELGNLVNLQILGIGLNQLSGSIPPVLGNLANLQILSIASNQLSGSIPPELGNLVNLQMLSIRSNRLTGSIPSNLTNLTNLINNSSELRWNALYTDDDTLRAFLNSKQVGSNWESTQTIAPFDVTATSASTSSIDISWTPIVYTSNSGGYRVHYSTSPGGPYTYFDMTADKTASFLTVTGLNPGTYYFVVQSRTDPHTYNQNTVDSEYSIEVSAVTYSMPSDIDGYIQDLPDNCFNNNASQRKNTFNNKLLEVQALIDAGNYQEAIDKLIHDIKAKIGTGQDDWINCPDGQETLIEMIGSLIEYLQGLL
jgi:hypothetical protein